MNTLDELRRARGEGWKWPLAQTEACPQCGYHPGAMPPDELVRQLLALAADWRAFLIGADDTYLRTNPEPGVFSPIQYAAHVRDIVGLYGDRVLLAIAENNPTVFSFMPAEEVWDSYNRLPVELLADDLEARARRMAAMFDDLRPSDWSRTVFRDGTKEERAEFTVLGLMAYSAHESYHHLLDAKGTLGA